MQHGTAPYHPAAILSCRATSDAKAKHAQQQQQQRLNERRPVAEKRADRVRETDIPPVRRRPGSMGPSGQPKGGKGTVGEKQREARLSNGSPALGRPPRGGRICHPTRRSNPMARAPGSGTNPRASYPSNLLSMWEGRRVGRYVSAVSRQLPPTRSVVPEVHPFHLRPPAGWV